MDWFQIIVIVLLVLIFAVTQRTAARIGQMQKTLDGIWAIALEMDRGLERLGERLSERLLWPPRQRDPRDAP